MSHAEMHAVRSVVLTVDTVVPVRYSPHAMRYCIPIASVKVDPSDSGHVGVAEDTCDAVVNVLAAEVVVVAATAPDPPLPSPPLPMPWPVELVVF